MSVKRLSALVVCPGRGSYTRSELGYLGSHHGDKAELLGQLDARRVDTGQVPISELDGARQYDAETHTRGDNASLLTFGCSYADFCDIESAAVDIVAVAGNSMGWYTALACAGAMTSQDAITLVDTMGRLTHDEGVGGQILFSLVDEEWRPDADKRTALDAVVEAISASPDCDVYSSIRLGGIHVLAGNDEALARLQREGPAGPAGFPLRLRNHAAFHTPLMTGVSRKAQAALGTNLFRSPEMPMVDGVGRIWRPAASPADELREYTLGTQVVDTYDFTASMRVALREFAPDCVIALGPGDTLGGPIGQILCELGWRGIERKSQFSQVQAERPFVLSMNRPTQRRALVSVTGTA